MMQVHHTVFFKGCKNRNVLGIIAYYDSEATNKLLNTIRCRFIRTGVLLPLEGVAYLLLLCKLCEEFIHVGKSVSIFQSLKDSVDKFCVI